MRTLLNLPFDKIIKRLPVNLSTTKRGDKGGNRAFEHGTFSFSIRGQYSLKALNLAPRIEFRKNIALNIIAAAAIFTIFCHNTAKAQDDSPFNRLQTKQAKELTISALKDMEKKNWKAAESKITQSKDPLATKIYLWRYFSQAEEKKSLSPGVFLRLSSFLRQNPNWPGTTKLRQAAEDAMPEDLPSREVLAWFDSFPPKTSEGMARYLEAMVVEGRDKEMREKLADWWAQSLISRDLQQRIFQKFGMYLTLDAHKKRFDALLLNGNYTNARAIAGVLGQGYPELAEARIALTENKSGVTALINKVPGYLQNDPGLLYERLKWRRQRNMDLEAMEILHKAPDAKMVQNPQAWWKERHIIIRRMLEKRQYKSATYLAEEHMQTEGLPYAEAEWLAGWLELRYLNQPTEAYQRFTAMYEKVATPISKGRAAYWAGRAAEGFHKEDLAKDWYEKAARYRSVYYGQMAIRKLAQTEGLPAPSAPTLSNSDIENFSKNELVQAAILFHDAGQRKTASDFLQAFVQSQDNPKAYRFGAELAAKIGQYHDAVKIAKRATEKGLFLTAQAYPVVTNWLRGDEGVEGAFIHAVIRQESMFDVDARSSAGATGLMQLMPGTAKDVAKKQNIAYNPGWLSSRPDYNIHLGSAYMRSLLKRYNNSYGLATAAYNAGPGNVDKWIKMFGDPRTGEIDLLDWIELIPVYETRDYVQRVMENLYIYRILLKESHHRNEADIQMVDGTNP